MALTPPPKEKRKRPWLRAIVIAFAIVVGLAIVAGGACFLILQGGF